jgi:hypothetical protein
MVAGGGGLGFLEIMARILRRRPVRGAVRVLVGVALTGCYG